MGLKKSEIKDGKKYCPHCEKWKFVVDFYKQASASTGLGSWCSDCTLKNAKEYWQIHPNHLPEYRRKQKLTIIDHYGGRCRCCGEKIPVFLTLSHIDNDGYKERKELFGSNSGGTRFYMWVIKNNFPKNLELLCWNCNQAVRYSGSCPHQIKSS